MKYIFLLVLLTGCCGLKDYRHRLDVAEEKIDFVMMNNYEVVISSPNIQNRISWNEIYKLLKQKSK